MDAKDNPEGSRFFGWRNSVVVLSLGALAIVGGYFFRGQEVELLKREKVSIEEEYKRSQEEISEKDAKIGIYETEAKSLKATIQTLEDKLTESQSSISQFLHAREIDQQGYLESREKAAGLQKQLDSLTAKKDNLAGRLKVARQENAAQKKEIKEYETLIGTYKSEANDLGAVNKTLKGELKETRASNSTLAQRLKTDQLEYLILRKSHEQEVAGLQGKIEVLVQDNQDIRNANIELNVKYKDIQQSVEEARNEVQLTTQLVEMKSAALTQINKKFEKLVQENQDLKTGFAELIKRYEIESTERMEINKELIQDNKKTRSSLIDITKKLDNLRKEYTVLDQYRKKLDLDYLVVKGQLQEQRTLVGKLKGQIEEIDEGKAVLKAIYEGLLLTEQKNSERYKKDLTEQKERLDSLTQLTEEKSDLLLKAYEQIKAKAAQLKAADQYIKAIDEKYGPNLLDIVERQIQKDSHIWGTNFRIVAERIGAFNDQPDKKGYSSKGGQYLKEKEQQIGKNFPLQDEKLNRGKLDLVQPGTTIRIYVGDLDQRKQQILAPNANN